MQTQIRGLAQEITGVQDQQKRISDERPVFHRAIKHYEEQIARLEEVQRAKEERLKQEKGFFVRDAQGNNVNGMWAAIQWLRNNQDKLKDKVYEPVRLVANSKTPEAAKYLESLISWDRSKVCQPSV